MSNPTPYDRQFGFAAYQAQSPSDPLPGDEVDSEFNAIKASLDETQAALADVRRSDGVLPNNSVGFDQLAENLLIGVSPAVPWTADTAFVENDIVFNEAILYRCIAAHTSGVSFDATKFLELADFSSLALPPDSVTELALASDAVTEVKIRDGAVSIAKLGRFPGSALMGRYSTAEGSVQFIGLGSGLSFSAGLLTADATAIGDGAVTTAKLAAGAVTNAKTAAGLAVANLGFTPVNRAGDSAISGVMQRTGQGAFLWHGGSYASGKVTVSGSSPSGGSDGDIWLQV